MSKLSFFAKEDAKVRHPHAAYSAGQKAQFVGWESVDGVLVVSVEPTSFESDGSMRIQNLLREVKRDGCLVPADAETAKACGLPFKSAESSFSKKDSK